MIVRRLRRGRRSRALAATAVAGLAAAACQPSLDTAEGRRAVYLDCARDQGVPVQDGTIRPRGPRDMRALDACEALPR
jgi:hypothetical protein